MEKILTLDEYKNYVRTVEDLLAIQEFFDEQAAVQARVFRARVISETDTVDEFAEFAEVPRIGKAPGPTWDAPSDPIAEAVISSLQMQRKAA